MFIRKLKVYNLIVITVTSHGLKKNPKVKMTSQNKVADSSKESCENPYVDEIVPSSFEYPLKFKELYPDGYRPIDEQIEDLASRFNLDGKKALEFARKAFVGKRKPEDMEGPFAYVYWPALDDSYEDAMTILLDEVKRVHPTLYNYIYKNPGWKNHQETDRKQKAIKAIHQIIKCDILVSWGQLGLKFCGHSGRCSYWMMEDDEFGAGVIEGGSVIITHPQRLTSLHIDLIGDKGGDDLNRAPDLFCFDKKVGLGGRHEKVASAQWGSMTFRPSLT